MGPLTAIQLIICGICLAIGLLHLALFIRLSEQRTNLWIALMCFCVAAGALFEAGAYHAPDIVSYNFGNSGVVKLLTGGRVMHE